MDLVYATAAIGEGEGDVDTWTASIDQPNDRSMEWAAHELLGDLPLVGSSRALQHGHRWLQLRAAPLPGPRAVGDTRRDARTWEDLYVAAKDRSRRGG